MVDNRIDCSNLAGQKGNVAESGGSQYLGDALPASLLLTSMPFAPITSVWNAIDGEPRGKRIVAFDCRFGEGKSELAALGRCCANGYQEPDPSLRLEQTDGWVFIYRPKELDLIPQQLTPMPELHAYLDIILGLAN
jgi:hypothetical protein